MPVSLTLRDSMLTSILLSAAVSSAESGAVDDHGRLLIIRLFQAEGRSLVRLARLFVDDRDAAEDLVQEAFLRLARSSERIQDDSKAPAYLRSIVLNLARDHNRRGLVSLRHHAAAGHNLGNYYAIAGREAHLSKPAPVPTVPGSVPTVPGSVPTVPGSVPSSFEVATDVTPDCPTRRAERLALLSITGQVMTTHSRLTGCLKARGDVLASVKTLPSGVRVAGFAGAQVCRLIHLCPWCSAKARDERAREIDRRTSGWLNAGGTALFAVFTIADEPGEMVSGTTTAVRACYTEMFRGGWLARFKKAYGFTGRIDAFEWTLGLDGSGHPHVQSILLFDRVLTPVQADRAVVMLRRRWLAVTDAQGRHADLLAGFRAERIGLVDGKCRAVARYMAKGSEAWTLGAELTRSDVKRSKHSMTFAPFDLVRYFAETGDTDAIFAWREFEKACRGVKSLRYSNGLKAVLDAACSLGRILVAIDLAEDDAEEDLAPEEDEIAEEVLEAGHVAVAVIEAPTWNWARRASHLDGLLTTLETCEAGEFVPALIDYLRRAGAPLHITAGVHPPDSHTANVQGRSAWGHDIASGPTRRGAS